MLSYAPARPISDSEVNEHLGEALSEIDLRGRRVLVIIPDDTRTLPMPTLFETLCVALAPRAKALTILIALGTHPPLTSERLARHLGSQWAEFPGVQVIQHEWDKPEGLAQVGVIEQDEMEEISRGLFAEAVPVEINRAVFTHDLVFILGPVFPHEVVGFSGGHKYFFPGVSGPDMVHHSHWLGALITNPKVNGHRETPIREMIERAATMVSTPRLGISLVMKGHDLLGIFLGEVKEAWAAATDLSAKENILWTDRPYHTVLSMAPSMYRELWTAGKCMYKLEPVVADGGKLIIYAPHITEISPTHGEWILKVGYHTRDYFLAQPERFQGVPRAVLAHSTHVKGIGTFRDGVERPRVEVVLATGIPDEICRKINLGCQDPDSICPAEFSGRKDEGVLIVSEAGETLYRLADRSVPDISKL